MKEKKLESGKNAILELLKQSAIENDLKLAVVNSRLWSPTSDPNRFTLETSTASHGREEETFTREEIEGFGRHNQVIQRVNAKVVNLVLNLKGKMSDLPRREKEYEIADGNVHQLGNRIWATFSVIGVIALTPVVAFVVAGSSNDLEMAPVSLIGAGLVALPFIWWLMAKRWWDVQHTNLNRMRELEKYLGIYLTRYVHYRDKTEPRFRSRGVQKSLSILPMIFALTWFSFSLWLGWTELKSLFCSGAAFRVFNWIGLITLTLEVFYGLYIWIKARIKAG